MREKMFCCLVIFTMLFLSVGFISVPPVEFQRVIVGFDKEISPATIRTHQGKVVQEFEFINAAVVEIPTHAVNSLAENPGVRYVEPDHTATAYSQTVPWGINRVNAPLVHNHNVNGAGIDVAVLDTGILLNHEDLNVVGCYSVFGGSYNDDQGHGTHVAGTIAALDNNIGVIGVAPAVNLYSVKVLDSSGSGSYSGIISGIEWAINNDMDIINMSLGGRLGSTALQEACDSAYESGVLVVAAAGNSGNSLGWGNNIGYPARYDSVIAVGSTTSNDVRSSFSSTGPALEIMAPGSNVLSTTYDGSYAAYNGTSMASPHVAGVAALLLASDPSLSNEEVRDILNTTANDMWNSPNRYGNGLVDAHAAYLYVTGQSLAQGN